VAAIAPCSSRFLRNSQFVSGHRSNSAASRWDFSHSYNVQYEKNVLLSVPCVGLHGCCLRSGAIESRDISIGNKSSSDRERAGYGR